MYSTKVAIPAFPEELPLLIRLEADAADGEVPACGLIYEEPGVGWFQHGRHTFEVHTQDPQALIGDVVLVNPHRGVGERILRRQSPHNTLLITERCDQRCVMCSQPPKDYELDLFDVYQRALPFAAPDAVIGISGGEPLLYKAPLFDLIDTAALARPDIGFHLLTNAQHLTARDAPRLAALPHGRMKVAVPLYAAEPEVHDRIVGKPGAFAAALDGIALLLEAGAEVEIRTIVMRQNLDQLSKLAHLLAWSIPDIAHWAVMQLEYIGFARKNWAEIFYDHSLDPEPLIAAVAAAEQHGVSCILYNMPLCTLPPILRNLAPRTISDWKQKYYQSCEGCVRREDCSGVFAWQPRDQTFARMEPLCHVS
ncbi:His-Xaa-Ser system radical SAM maturase HxsC [Poseidonocella sedimentorum]|uniref:His-Xaa-Ser system radical SAM maturase HxsC n=1 Tax=Poseidonocella sedimentorum TaxID=871652 RepID=A0A1I6CVY2_9RHOB|nr:His-Xaa-Ser system radical SAM maturase HxsC [Poseidonocella sedimentorum]SFQ97348.1 His-Xaa-Ser system radical SAM maturase HxsC [Poseidonocella sedimentorum]